MWANKEDIRKLQIQLDAITAVLEKLLNKLKDTELESIEIKRILAEFWQDYKKTVMPVYTMPESTKFVPQDKKLFIEEEKEFTNIYK